MKYHLALFCLAAILALGNAVPVGGPVWGGVGPIGVAPVLAGPKWGSGIGYGLQWPGTLGWGASGLGLGLGLQQPVLGWNGLGWGLNKGVGLGNPWLGAGVVPASITKWG